MSAIRMVSCPLTLASIFLSGTLSATPYPWLTFDSPSPSHLVVNWETDDAKSGQIHYRQGNASPVSVPCQMEGGRHRARIPYTQEASLSYRIDDGPWHVVRPLPKNDFRAVVIGDWGYAMEKDFASIRSDAPHLLLTVGDNVPSLHEKGHEGAKAFTRMVSLAPDILAVTPFMPILGNHDREITHRGPKPPEHPVYDIEATAYRDFFALPGDEWRWTLDIPQLDLRFIALDLNHVSDFGTTWQTCHDHRPDADQLAWFTSILDRSPHRHVVTLMNEKRTSLKGTSATGNSWLSQFLRGSAVLTGYGYFGEVAKLSGKVPYLNTCLQGSSDKYPDPESDFITTKDTYVLIKIPSRSGPLVLQMKDLTGKVLHSIESPARAKNH